MDYVEWLIIPGLLLLGLWMKNLFRITRETSNQSVVHLPYTNGTKWPSPHMDSVLINARFENVEYDSENRRYTARSISKKPWAGIIEVVLIEYQGDYQVKCTSRSALITQLIGWGVNQRNVQRFTTAYSEIQKSEV